jgi:hypothetical protein
MKKMQVKFPRALRTTLVIAAPTLLAVAGFMYAQQQNFDNVVEHVLPVQGFTAVWSRPTST